MLSWYRLNFQDGRKDDLCQSEVKLYQGDARNLDLIEDNSADLIATHPPYAGIIKYSKSKRSEGDLSRATIEGFLYGMRERSQGRVSGF